MSCIDPYKLLGLTVKDKRDDVRNAFKSLSLLCHPDKGGRREDMEVLYIAYKYILEQIEFGEHGRTMEDEENKFKRFLEYQKLENFGIPSIGDITVSKNRRNRNFEYFNI